AQRAIEDIGARGKVPILVGGSGLYVDAVIYDYQFADPGASRSQSNPRHLADEAERMDKTLRPNTLIIGIKLDKDVLKERVRKRVDGMADSGFLEEVRRLRSKYAHS